jgi:beta-glucosidase-like glycosyl hydrolase
MTVDEKIGQLVHIGVNARYHNQDHPEFIELKRHITENKVGGIIVFAGGLYETVHFVNRMQENAKIPLLISSDFETGVGMRFDETINFPWNMALTATGNPELARKQGEIIGREARALGVHQVFAPVVDVNNNSDNPVINTRSYGENPNDVAKFAVAFTEGLQSQKILATAKHFPGHGDTNVDSHRGLPIIDVDKKRLDSIELVPFKAVIDAGIGSVMIAHIGLPQIDSTIIKPLKNSINLDTDSAFSTENATMPSTLSPLINTQILHKELGFKGLTVTDAMSMSGLTQYFNQDEAAVKAFLAGSDILEKPADIEKTLKGLRDAVNSGQISMERLNDSVRKQLAWKHELGLFQSKITPLTEIDKVVSSAETRNLADEISKNAITLVKNNNKILPLEKGNRVTLLCITNGEDRNFVGVTFARTLLQLGLKVDRIVIEERTNQEEINDTIAKIKRADIVIAALYARVRSGAKNSIGLPASSLKILEATFADKKKSVGISFGNPYLLKNFPQFDSFIIGYGDMGSLQRAVANGILGNQDFLGKLPITIGEYKIGTGLSLK